MPIDLKVLDDLGSDKAKYQITEGDNSPLGQLFHKYATQFIERIEDNLKKSIPDAEASNIFNSVRQEVEINGNEFRFYITAPQYWEYLDQGRNAGKMPPIKSIVDWINRKPTVKARLGLTKSNLKGKLVATLGDITAPVPVLEKAFAIAKGISKHGTKPTYFFSEIVTDEYRQNFGKEISEIIGKSIAVNIIVGIQDDQNK